MNIQKRPRQNSPNAENVVKCKKERKMEQAIINCDAYKKKLREEACRCLAQWIYDAEIPFNAVKLPSFKVMIESISQYGIGMELPTYHEVGVTFLNKAVAEVRKSCKACEDGWTKYGCSIMVDCWTDKERGTLINFSVNSPDGTVFLESIDAFEYTKTGEKMLELLDSVVERV